MLYEPLLTSQCKAIQVAFWWLQVVVQNCMLNEWYVIQMRKVILNMHAQLSNGARGLQEVVLGDDALIS